MAPDPVRSKVRPMARAIPRRTVLKQIGLAGAGVMLSGGVFRGQSAPIRIAGRAVEIAVASVTASTVRITVLPIDGTPVPEDGALVAAAAGRPAGRAPATERFAPIRAGDLTVRFTAGPPVLHVERRDGTPVQTLTLNEATPAVSFLLPKGPLLGFGEGGPQFDRKGSTDRMRNGQGGYQLRTHGGRVPIQFLIGTDGWGLYIHQPVVA